MIRKTPLKHLTLIMTIVIAIIWTDAALCGDDPDIATVRDRLVGPLLTAPSHEAVDGLLETMKLDGSWPEVDYTDTSGGNWKTAGHLSRLYTLVRAFAATDSDMRGNDKIRDAAMRSLDYWLEHDFRNPNWWHNQIGVPGRMARCMLLLDGEMNDEQLAEGIAILERAKIRMTGANLVDVAFITVMRGVIENKPDVVAEAVASITDEIRITTEEGVQPDFSFHQHGALLYNHGYGAVFMSNCSDLATVVAGTRFAFPKEKIDILSGLILDGTRWMIRYSTKDYGATGRGLSRRSGKSKSAGYLREVVDNMLRLPTGRNAEYREMAAYLDGDSGSSVIGNRNFRRSDFMAHHREGWYASARMFSDRLLNTDRPHNNEGLLSHHLGDGCTYIMKNGMEYHDIFPVWDWRMIPGTTAVQASELSGDICRTGTRPYAGGVSDGMYGMAAFDFERDGLTARKAWCFFDDEIVCLGAGISAPGNDRVVTTVNQCYLRGSVLVPGGRMPKALNYGSHDLDGTRFVYHDGAAYVFPGEQSIRLENDARTGTWHDINHQYSEDEISHDLFTLSIDHGKKPRNETYAYIVAPVIEAKAVMEYASSPPVEIVANTPEVQAVRHTMLDITCAAFYEPGTVTASDTSIEADKPCIVMLRNVRGERRLSVSQPEHKADAVTVTLRQGGKTTRTIFDLPGGTDAGTSVTKTVE